MEPFEQALIKLMEKYADQASPFEIAAAFDVQRMLIREAQRQEAEKAEQAAAAMQQPT